MVIYFNETWQSEGEGSTTAYNAFNCRPVSREDYDYLNDLVSRRDQECQTEMIDYLAPTIKYYVDTESQTILTELPIINDTYSIEIILSNKERLDQQRKINNELGSCDTDDWEDIATRNVLINGFIPRKYLEKYGFNYKSTEIENTPKVKSILDNMSQYVSKVDSVSTVEVQTDLTEPPQRIYIRGITGQANEKRILNWGNEVIISEGEFQMACMLNNTGNKNIIGPYIDNKFGQDLNKKEIAISDHFKSYHPNGSVYWSGAFHKYQPNKY
jgi:hypothetical protein